MARLFLVALLLLSLAHKIEGRSGSKLDGQLDRHQKHGADVDNGASKGLGAAFGQQVKTKDFKKRQVLKGKMQRNKTKRFKKKKTGLRSKNNKNRRQGQRTGKENEKQQREKKKKKRKRFRHKKVKKKGKKADNEKKNNRSCDVGPSCIVNAQTVLLYEKNQVSNYLKQSSRLRNHYAIAGNKLVKNTSFQSAAKYLLWSVGGDFSDPRCGDLSGNSTKGLETKAAELRFIVSNYSRLSNCSTSIVKECTISTEMYNSTIAEEMSLCNSSMWEFILVSRSCFQLQKQSNNATEVCDCWQRAADLVTAIKKIKCSASARTRMITKQKNACKQIFKECKEAEDKSVNLIYNCMNEHSLKYINQTAKDLHLGIVTDAKTLFKTLEQGKDLGDWMIT